MIWNLGAGWLMMAVAAVSVLGYFFGSALHAIMREDGFGPLGNTILFVGGFFLTIFVANSYGINLKDLTQALAWGLGGAFGAVCSFALIKAGFTRLT